MFMINTLLFFCLHQSDAHSLLQRQTLTIFLFSSSFLFPLSFPQLRLVPNLILHWRNRFLLQALHHQILPRIGLRQSLLLILLTLNPFHLLHQHLDYPKHFSFPSPLYLKQCLTCPHLILQALRVFSFPQYTCSCKPRQVCRKFACWLELWRQLLSLLKLF